MITHMQSEDRPIGHVTSPIVTGGAVIALKFDQGVIIATDTLLSYGGLLSIMNHYVRIHQCEPILANF